MDKLKENMGGIWGKLKSSPAIIGIVVATLILIGCAVYIFVVNVKPKLDPTFVPNQEFSEGNIKEATLYIFHTTWCPHSKKAMDVFKLVKEEYKEKQNKVGPNNKIFFTAVNGESEEEDMAEFEKTHSVKVDGFPTIFLVNGTNVVEFDALTTKDTLTQFIETIL